MTVNDDGSVIITLKDVYDKLLGMEDDVRAAARAVPDHETRIRSLERWMYALPAALLASVASVIIAVVGRH